MACKGLDAQVVRPDDPELAQLLQQFVPVRITNFKGVDKNRFRFDYDLTFAVLMMNAEGHTYARFGTRDEKEGTARMSIAGLKQAMRDVLAAHRAGARAAAPAGPRQTLADLPAFARTKMAKQECFHCHFANNARFLQLRAEGRFTKEMLFQYPLPETIGISLDVDRNNVVKTVAPGSAAAAAGVRPGDKIARAGAVPVYSSADLQFALNDIADPGTLTLYLERAGGRPPGGPSLPAVTLKLPRGWRRHDISWRASQGSIPPSVGFWGKPLTDAEKRERGIAPDRLGILVNFLFPGPEWAKTRGGLQNNDIVVGLDGQTLPAMDTRQFHSNFRLKFNVGDTATLNILRDGQPVELRVPCIDVKEE